MITCGSKISIRVFEVRLSRTAVAYLRRIDRPTRERVMAKLSALAEDPLSASKALTNAQGRRSARVGDLRIIFTIDNGAQVVAVSHIGPRGQVYRTF